LEDVARVQEERLHGSRSLAFDQRGSRGGAAHPLPTGIFGGEEVRMDVVGVVDDERSGRAGHPPSARGEAPANATSEAAATTTKNVTLRRLRGPRKSGDMGFPRDLGGGARAKSLT
jgi:hypothetical protein